MLEFFLKEESLSLDISTKYTWSEVTDHLDEMFSLEAYIVDV